MLSTAGGSGLIGRRSECEVLDQLVDSLRAGRSGVLVLRGEAGVGKTALLDHLATRASACHVLRAAGTESEMELAFAGVHLLCAPLLERMERLPARQRDALGTAFGLVAGEAADRFLVALAVLHLLSDAAEERPLVCLVDDAQWLDQASVQILAFVARRLLAESVALVFGVRQPIGVPALDGLPERMIGGLSNDDARVLLDSASLGRLDELVRDRIVAETSGNPLALLELPRGLTAAELAGGFALPDAQPISSHVEWSFVRRIRTLPDDTQRLLLAAAAESVGDVVLLRRAARLLGIGREAEDPAEAEGLIEFGTRVRFRHPLVRSAAYRSASPSDRKQTHQALADATDSHVDPDRRAWHRAHAAAGPDEDVAADLERSAERARGRGGVAAAAAFLEQAAELSPHPAQRGVRALAAAQAKFDAGAFDTADSLLAAAEINPLDDLQRAQVARLRAEIVFVRQRGGGDAAPLLDAARGLEGLDDELSRTTYLDALVAAIYGGHLGPHPHVRAVAEAARRAPASPTPPRPIDLLLDGAATRFTDGYGASLPAVRAALEAYRRHFEIGGDGTSRSFWLAWLFAGELWDDALMGELATKAVQRARDSGALASLPIGLTYLAAVHIFAGELSAASVLIEEANAITTATGYAPLGYASSLLIAWRGDKEKLLSYFAWAMDNAKARGEGRALGLGRYMSAILHNGLGRYQDAFVDAEAACEHDDFGYYGFALVELVEAGLRSGAHSASAEALRELERRTRAAGTDWALGILARSQALAVHGQAAEALYVEAIDRLKRTRVLVDLARAHLLYGEWLRREGRRVDARAQLRVAHEMLSAFGAEAFAERARGELLATGETARRRTLEARDLLTAQETQIARLTAEGHTNPEIGSQLFISPRTVEYHLSKVFTKLGITSRRELREALPRLERA